MITPHNLIEKTIKAHLKHMGLEIKNGMVFKGAWACYTEDLDNRMALFTFLEGMSAVFDNVQQFKDVMR